MPAGARNLADLVRAAAPTRPDHPALVHGERALSWADLDAAVDAAAAGLPAGLRLKRRDRVALLLGNTLDFVTAYFGLLRAGLVAVPVNTGYTSVELARVLADTGAAAVLCGDDTLPVAEEAVAGTHRAIVDRAGLDALVAEGRPAGRQEPVGGGEDVAVLMSTSGTSGRPRAAMLSHRALLANLDQCLRLEPPPVRPDDVVLLALPLFHVYGLGSALGLVAATGATGVLVERFDPGGTAEVVRRRRVTVVPGAPGMFAAWADSLGDVPSVRLLASGAAPLPPSVLEAVRARTGLPVYEGYGLTETAPVLTSTLVSGRVKPGSVGAPLPGVELRLLDEQGEPVADGDPGEVWVRGENLFSGYWPDGADGPGPDGWWATGDVAFVDGDGDLVLVDRRKELIIVNGFNVYPREVEEAIASHPDVAEVAVIGVPDEQTGEAVQALVVPRAGAVLDRESVAAHAATRLARFKRPSVIEIVYELPHSATGKVAKGTLRTSAAARSDGVDPGVPREPT